MAFRDDTKQAAAAGGYARFDGGGRWRVYTDPGRVRRQDDPGRPGPGWWPKATRPAVDADGGRGVTRRR